MTNKTNALVGKSSKKKKKAAVKRKKRKKKKEKSAWIQRANPERQIVIYDRANFGKEPDPQSGAPFLVIKFTTIYTLHMNHTK